MEAPSALYVAFLVLLVPSILVHALPVPATLPSICKEVAVSTLQPALWELMLIQQTTPAKAALVLAPVVRLYLIAHFAHRLTS